MVVLPKERLRLAAGPGAGLAGAVVGGRGRLEVLAQERHARRRGAAGAHLFPGEAIWYCGIVGAEGRLVGGEDE